MKCIKWLFTSLDLELLKQLLTIKNVLHKRLDFYSTSINRIKYKRNFSVKTISGLINNTPLNDS